MPPAAGRAACQQPQQYTGDDAAAAQLIHCCRAVPRLVLHYSPAACPCAAPRTRAGVIPEVRRRRYFENSVDAKKRKVREARMAAKRQTGGVRSFGQVSGQEPAPFSDMFGGEASEIDIFF